MKNKVIVVTGENSSGTFTKIYFNVNQEYAVEQFKKQVGSEHPSSQVVEFDESINLISYNNQPVSVTSDPTVDSE